MRCNRLRLSCTDIDWTALPLHRTIAHRLEFSPEKLQAASKSGDGSGHRVWAMLGRKDLDCAHNYADLSIFTNAHPWKLASEGPVNWGIKSDVDIKLTTMTQSNLILQLAQHRHVLRAADVRGHGRQPDRQGLVTELAKKFISQFERRRRSTYSCADY